MKPFVFSADSHIMEPKTLFLDNLPTSLKDDAVHARKEGDYLITGTSNQDIYRIRVGANNEKVLSDRERRGLHDLEGRLEDMNLDGVDAEICFPSLGLWLYALNNPDAETASCQVYNDWNDRFLGGHLDRFVRCGILPVKDLSATLSEMRRISKKGFTAAMLPAAMAKGLPKYNDPRWDEVFELASQLGIVIVMHCGTGLESVTSERGPGGAVINYSSQLTDAVTTCMYLVAGGVLDRHPEAKVAFIESGASWVAAIGERMDEVYDGHSNFVRPKLSIKPSEIIRRQIYASFQHDKAAIMTRKVTGVDKLMWASDYPHAEGTFPMSRYWMEEVFTGVDNITPEEKAMILGGNAARLFRLNSPAAGEPVAA